MRPSSGTSSPVKAYALVSRLRPLSRQIAHGWQPPSGLVGFRFGAAERPWHRVCDLPLASSPALLLLGLTPLNPRSHPGSQAPPLGWYEGQPS